MSDDDYAGFTGVRGAVPAGPRRRLLAVHPRDYLQPDGCAVLRYEKKACRMEYRIRCDPSWRTRSATAAWVEFPSLRVKPLAQVYERVDRRVVRYESAGGNFRKDLHVPASGFVTEYPGLWELASV